MSRELLPGFLLLEQRKHLVSFTMTTLIQPFVWVLPRQQPEDPRLPPQPPSLPFSLQLKQKSVGLTVNSGGISAY